MAMSSVALTAFFKIRETPVASATISFTAAWASSPASSVGS